jgi:predicted ATPase
MLGTSMHPSADPSVTSPLAWPAAPPPTADGVLIGRSALVDALVRLLLAGDDRLVTLTGTGGGGKTRVAIEAAARLLEPFDGRVAWVSLAALTSAEQVPTEIAAAFGLADVPADRLGAELTTVLGDGPSLLVLDNLEHVVAGAAAALPLLADAAGLRILVTSRTPLGQRGERIIAVEPLEVPEADASAEEIASSGAVELLVDRARWAGAALEVGDHNAATIARIVRRVDGLPLAIQLAAAMLKVVSPHQLADRLDERLEVLDTADRLLPQRQRSLRATMDWSYALLPPEVRTLYRRLGAFNGPFAGSEVRAYLDRSVEHGLAAPRIEPEVGLATLVAASLLRVVPPAGAGDSLDDPTYELVGIVRDDAARRLAESGEGTAARWALANLLLEVAESVDAELVARSSPEALGRIDAVHCDLLAVLDGARADGNAAFVVRLAGALAEYWRARGLLTEGRLWLDAALRASPGVESSHRARALHGAGMLANWQSDFGRARQLLEEALALRLKLGQRLEAASTLNQIGLLCMETGNGEEAEILCRQALELRRDVGDEAAVAASLNTLGGVLQYAGRREEAGELFEESLAIRRRLADDAGASVSMANLALVARDLGDLDGARAMLEESIATRERLGDRQRLAVVRHNHALVLFEQGDLAAAAAELDWSISVARELGDRLELSNALSDRGFVSEASGDLDRAAGLQADALSIATRIGARGIMAQSIDGIAGVTACRSRELEAASLWAAAETIRRVASYAMLLADRRRIDRSIEAARATTDEEAWWRAWAAGEAMNVDDAVALALATADPDRAAVPARAAV